MQKYVGAVVDVCGSGQHANFLCDSTVRLLSNICMKTFRQLRSLKRHWRTHSRDGLLVCDTCDKKVIQSQAQGHSDEILSDDHFDCNKCNKQFAEIQSLIEHNGKEHGTSYQCDVCKELEARQATGIGYICCVCDAEYEIATELEDHEYA